MGGNNRRHSTGFGYIGFGNNQSVFNRHSKKPFSKVKERLNYEAELHYEVDFYHHKLSKAEKKAIKDKIRKDARKRNIKASLISIIIFGFVVYGSLELIKSIMIR